MKRFLLLAIILMSFTVFAQNTEPVIFQNSYAKTVDIKDGKPQNHSEVVYYPTTIVVDIFHSKLTMSYTDSIQSNLLKCDIIETDLNDDYTDIIVQSPSGEPILFRFFDDSIYMLMGDTAAIFTKY